MSFNRHLHLELCRIARDWHMMFKIQLTIEALSYLIHLTLLCYYLCVTILKFRMHRSREKQRGRETRVARNEFIFHVAPLQQEPAEISTAAGERPARVSTKLRLRGRAVREGASVDASFR